MPNEIKVGTQIYQVILRTPKEDGMLNDGNFGYTLDSGLVIVIDATISPTKQRVTLLHELMHAIQMTFGSPTKPSKDADFEEWEHYFIGTYEESMLIVLQDNPSLLKYLSA
jgi:hypothetical protein